MYVIVYCGYEGLERIFWTGADKEQAAQVTQWIRDRIWWAKQVERIVVGPEPSMQDNKKWNSWTTKRYKLWERFGCDLSPYSEAHRVCVQSERKPLYYGCACKELGVETGKEAWLY